MEIVLEHADPEYGRFVEKMQERVQVGFGSKALFRTTGVDLFEVYLSGFEDPAERQYHNCNCCKHFMHRYGGLVSVGEQGELFSAVFDPDDAPTNLRVAVRKVVKAIETSRLSEVFISDLKVLGVPQAGGWQHLSLLNPNVWTSRAKAAHEAVAEKQQDFQQVVRALSEFPLDLLNQVVELLDVDGDALFRGEKVLGPAKFLRDVQSASQNLKGQQRRNVIFNMVASAPAGFCHPRSSMIGTLLDDLQNGLSLDRAAVKLMTAAVPDSPPILQWDSLEKRNPLSWYVYQDGSYASQWGLGTGWMDVPAVLQIPARWNGNELTHFSNQILFVLPQARDSKMSGSALFPECLKSELHAVRSTIEAFSRSTEAVGREEGNVNGLSFSDKASAVTVRVMLGSGVVVAYTLDRWE